MPPADHSDSAVKIEEPPILIELDAFEFEPRTQFSAWTVVLPQILSAEAAVEFETALDTDPQLTEALYNLGAAYDAMRDTNRALTAYQAAVRADPTFAPAYVGLGNVLQDQGKSDEALAAYRKAVELVEFSIGK